MPQQNFVFETRQRMRFVITDEDEDTALRRARELLEAHHETDYLGEIDITFGDWYLDLIIDGTAPIELVEINDEPEG